MSFKLGNTNISELYVGSTKIGSAYLGSTKVYEGSAPIYNVTVNQSTGGTITASPLFGINGTEITLSNSPSTNYEFVSYSVNGATLSGNKFTINNSDVTVTGTFSKYVEEWVNLGTTEYARTGKR